MPPLQLDSKTILFLLLFGIIYGFLVQESRKRAPASKPFLFLWVTGGVAGTVLLVSDVVGYTVTQILALAFLLTGGPVSIVTIFYYVKEAEKTRKAWRLENREWPGEES